MAQALIRKSYCSYFLWTVFIKLLAKEFSTFGGYQMATSVSVSNR